MIRWGTAGVALMVVLLTGARLFGEPRGGGLQQGTEVTPADAAPFVGDWTLTLQGPNGPGSFDLSVTVEKDKVVGAIANESVPRQPIRSMSKDDKTLVLSYSFTWDGNPVETVVSMTPAADGKMEAKIDFANGAYVMIGTAAKKVKTK